MSGPVELFGVVASGSLVLVAIGISWWAGLRLERDLVTAGLRAAAQLALLGLVLVAILAPGQPLILSWAWVAVMVVFAGWTVQRRVPQVPRIWLLSMGAFTASAVVTLGVLFGAGVFPVDSTTVVPLAGLMIGNSMTATVLVARRITAEFKDKRLEIEARLALGEPSAQAAAPYLREALRTALIPQIETTKAVGIVFLPGMMVGLLLAGVTPLDAVQAQLVIMYLVLGSVAVTTSVIALGMRRILFTPAHQLRPLSGNLIAVRAIVQPRYGPPESVELRDVPEPAPKTGEVSVRVRAASVNAADIEILGGWWMVRMASPLRPASRIVGSDVAGVVERVGPGVTAWQAGDEVMGDLSEHGYSTFAELVTAPALALAPKPSMLTFEEAAAVPAAAWVAIKGIRARPSLGPGSHVLVNGAGGGMGTFALQMAAARGARVTGVDGAAKLELIRSLGADRAIDFRVDDPTRSVERYELVLDVQAHRSVRDWQRVLTPDGTYLMVGGSGRRILQGALLGQLAARSSEQTLGILPGWPHARQDMDEVNELIVSGSVRPVVERTYPLAEAAAALRHVADGRALGKIVIAVAGAGA